MICAVAIFGSIEPTVEIWI